MQPPSIINFSRIFLASVGVTALLAALNFPALRTTLLRQDPAAASLGDGVLILALALGIAVLLVLWFLIARRASNVAKWVLVALTAVSVALQAPKVGAILMSLDPIAALGLLAAIGQIAAIGFLFRADAREWLSHDEPLDFADVG
jgi:hypothetical protein